MFELLVLAGIVLILAYIVGMMDLIRFFVFIGLVAFVCDPVGSSHKLGQVAVELHDTLRQTMDRLK